MIGGENMKKRYAVTFVSLLLIAAMAMSLGGCGLVTERYKEKKMVRYLNKKYPEDHFVYEETYGGTALGGLFGDDQVAYILCSSENYPDISVRVEYFWLANKYYDNYLGIKYAKDMDDYASTLIQEFFPEHKTDHYSFCKRILDGSTECTTISADATFEEYLTGCCEPLMMAVEYPEDELDKGTIQDAVTSILEEKNVGYSQVRIFFVTELDPSKDFYDYNYNELRIVLDEDNHIKSVKWVN